MFNFTLTTAISALFAFIILLVMDFKLSVAIAGITGVVVFISQIFAKDRKRYWFIIFILAIPLVAPKILGSREFMESVMGRYGVPSGSPPVLRILFSDIILFILFAIWGFRLCTRRESFFFPKPAVYLTLFIIWSLLSFVNSINLSYSIFELLRLIKFLLFYIFITNTVKSKKDLKTLVICLAIGAIIQGAICILEYKYQISVSLTGYSYASNIIEDKPQGLTVGYGLDDDTMRGSGTVGPHNIEAMYFELMLPLIFCLAVIRRKWYEIILYASAFILASIGLYFTFSRGGLIGTAIALTVAFLLLIWKRILPKEAFITVCLIAIISSFFLTGKIEKFMNTRKGAFEQRIEMSKVGLKMLKDHPVLGFGLNTSVIHLPDYDTKDVTIGYPVHNYYLIVATEVGLIGLLFLLIFYSKNLSAGIKVMRAGDNLMTVITIGILSSFCGAAIHMGIDLFGEEAIQTILFLYGGTLVAMKKIEDEETDDIKPVSAEILK